MSYEKTNWQTGDIVAAGLLNHMERGIAQNASDIEDLSADATELKITLNDINETLYTNGNLVTGGEVISGYLQTSGTNRILAEYNNMRSVIIPVERDVEYHVNNNGTANTTVIGLFTEKPVIGAISDYWINMTSTHGGIISIPDGYTYMCVQFYDSRYDAYSEVEALNHLLVSDKMTSVYDANISRTADNSIDNTAIKGLSKIFRTTQDGYTSYYCRVYNPSGSNVEYTDRLIQLKVNFDIGECPDETFLKVFLNGAEVPSQFDGCRYSNYALDYNNTFWANGSIKSGTLFVYGTIEANGHLDYEIRVYRESKNNNYSKIVTNNGTENSIDFSVSDSNGNTYSFRGKYSSAGKRIYAKNGDTSFTDQSTYNTPAGRKYIRDANIDSIELIGSGVVFKEVVYTFSNEGLTWKMIYRIYNGSIEIKHFALSKKDITDWGLRDWRPTMHLGNGVTGFDTSLSNNYYAYNYEYNGVPCTVSVIYTIGNIPRSDTTPPSIPNFVPTVTAETISNIPHLLTGWVSSSGKWDVPKDFVFASCIIVTFDADTSEYIRQFNPLCGFASKTAPNVIKYAIKNKLIPHMLDVSDYIQNNGISAGGMAGWSKYCRYKYKKTTSLITAVTLFKQNVMENYNLSDKQSFLDAYETWQLPYMGRTMPLAYEYYKECITAGDSTNAQIMKDLCIACGEAMVDVLHEYNDIPLTAGQPDTARNNARTMALHLIAIACVLSPNDENLSTGYQELGQIIIANSDFNTMLKEGNLSTSRYTHYMAMALIDWILSNKLKAVTDNTGFLNYDNFVMDTTEPSGEIKDQTYCPSTARRGLEHTYAYYAGSLMMLDNYSGYKCAELLIDHLIDNSLPDGNFVFPMDGYTDVYLGTQAIAGSLPFELAAFMEVLNTWTDIN